MASHKMLPHLIGSKGGEGEGQNRSGPNSELVSKNDLRRLGYLSTADAQLASTMLHKLTDEDPELSLTRNGMLIDTDPRHMGSMTLEEAALPGVSSQRRHSFLGQMGSKGKGGDEKGKAAVSYMIPEQAAAEELALQERILYEMRQNLTKLKEYGRQLGITFDVSKKKSKQGRMQGERWVDDEMDAWKKQATRLLKAPEDNKPEPEDEERCQRMGEYVFKVERMLNDMRFMRLHKQRQRDTLSNELSVVAAQEQREQSGDGKMAILMSAVSNLKEKIQDCDQKLQEEDATRRELTKSYDTLWADSQQNQSKLDAVQKDLTSYEHDYAALRLQLKDKLHDIEKVLGQGKLLTMAEIKEEISGKYQKELEARQRLIQKQIKIKEMLQLHEGRVRELTRRLQSQYDPNKDSPRRNELKSKAKAFEEVFDTMMQRIGESDITKIVDLFQKQSFTCNAWMEAVRDQEVRVKALMDEKELLERQLLKVAGKKPQGFSNETRQYTMSGKKLDMATEKLDTSHQRLMQLEGLIAHMKESVRVAFLRVKDYIPEVEPPPIVYPDEGEGGLIEQLERFTEQVKGLIPTQEQHTILQKASDQLQLPSEYRVDENEVPYGLGMPSPEPRRPHRSQERPPPLAEARPASTHSDREEAKPAAAASSEPQEEKEDKKEKDKKEVPPEHLSMPHKLKVAIKMSPTEDIVHGEPAEPEEQVDGMGMNVRIAFPPPRPMQKQILDKEREEDEQEARAEHLDETIVSREEHKRRALRLIKQKERDKAEKDALDLGEIPVSKKKKKAKSALR
mmetsp:Transcript_50027/g.122125  ORF Transcript_50027/g.122125 Transcript_50027/m.122125 type:complete len:792 (+) Transcript_50027:21-2396(+)